MYGSTRRTNSALLSRSRLCALGPERTAALPGAAAGRARRGPVRIHAHRPAGSVRGHSGCRRLGMRGDRQLSGPVLGYWLADDPVHRRAIYRLLLHQEIDELLELGPVRADELDGGLLCLAYQPGNLTVDEGLGCLGEGPAGQPLPASTAEEYRAALGIPDGPSAGDRPNSRTILIARSVALARSLAAPVEPCPNSTSSAARPPSRTARESVR